MDFSLTEEQQMFRDMFGDFARQEVAPLAEAIDRAESAPLETLHKAAGLDLLGIALPEQYGGMNAGLLAYGLLMEELGGACLSTAVALNAHCATTMLIAAGGSDQQKLALLPGLARGEQIGAYAVVEPDAGSDLTHLTTIARLDGDGFVLRGRKSLVVNADAAGLLVVLAATPDGRTGAFVVEKSTPGLTIGWREKQMGLRGASGCAVFLDDCSIPRTSWLGGESVDGLAICRRGWTFARLGLAYAALGIAERGLADSLEFARNRQQFGGPIALKQAIQGYLGDMATQIETLRHLAYHTTWLMEQGKAGERDIATLKLWAGQVAAWVINKAVQIHGGMGYIKSFHVERLYRDARALSVLEGTAETQRVTVAGALLKGVGVDTRL
jgi:alkylation response protein AidB-like acyl-CoA dehydrogenase